MPTSNFENGFISTDGYLYHKHSQITFNERITLELSRAGRTASSMILGTTM
jgi:hypothetical protein